MEPGRLGQRTTGSRGRAGPAIVAFVTVALCVLANTASASADSVALSPAEPVYAGTNDATVTVSGSAQSNASIEVEATIKPSGGVCAPDPSIDSGDQLSGDNNFLTAGADGSFAWHGTPTFQDIDSAGNYLLCGWLLSGGTVTSASAVMTVSKPAVSVSVTAPKTLPAGKFGTFTLATIHYDVGSADRFLVYTTLQPASKGCGPVNPDAGGGPFKLVTGAGSVAAQISGFPLPNGTFVACAYVGDRTGNEVDGYASSNVTVIGRGYCYVPRLVGKKLAAAARAVRRAGCGEGHLRYVHTRKRRRARVVSQHPAPGTRVDFGSPVDVVVGCGRIRRLAGINYCVGLPPPS